MIGIDEVGRGCLAGPLLVVAARQDTELPDGLTDSKLLSRGKREFLYEEIIISCQFGEGWVQASEIDELGLAKALRLGVKRALQSLKAEGNEEVIIDGKVNYAPKYYLNVRCLVSADKSVPTVSAASVYAKVKRDRYMFKLAKIYPEYGFEAHVGYGTRRHLDALQKYGYVEKLHRQLYAPIKSLKRAKAWQPA